MRFSRFYETTSRDAGFLEIRCMVVSSGEKYDIGSISMPIYLFHILSLDHKMMYLARRRRAIASYESHAVWEIKLRSRLAFDAAKKWRDIREISGTRRRRDALKSAVCYGTLGPINRKHAECRKNERVRRFSMLRLAERTNESYATACESSFL